LYIWCAPHISHLAIGYRGKTTRNLINDHWTIFWSYEITSHASANLQVQYKSVMFMCLCWSLL